MTAYTRREELLAPTCEKQQAYSDHVSAAGVMAGLIFILLPPAAAVAVLGWCIYVAARALIYG